MKGKKQVKESKGGLEIPLLPATSYAYKSDLPELSGYTWVGPTPEAALINAKSFLNHYYRVRGYWPINIYPKDEDGSTT